MSTASGGTDWTHGVNTYSQNIAWDDRFSTIKNIQVYVIGISGTDRYTIFDPLVELQCWNAADAGVFTFYAPAFKAVWSYNGTTVDILIQRQPDWQSSVGQFINDGGSTITYAGHRDWGVIITL